MSDFATILARVERRSAQQADAPSRRVKIRTLVDVEIAPIVACAREARENYAAQATYARVERRATTHDAAGLRTEIIAAAGDARRLKTLRRHAARAFHPDRGGDGAELAACNALIDTALRTSRKRT